MEPIALIPELTKSLGKTAKRLEPWNALTRLEEQLLRRARSAFLVHWFGLTVPVRRLNLYIVIVNIAALRERFRRVQESRSEQLPTMNLLGPLSGITGVIVGMFLNPVSGIIIGHELSELLADLSGHNWLYWLALVPGVVTSWLGQLTGLGLILFIGAPLAIAGAFVMAGQRETRAIVELMGHLALLIDAALDLWDQISGPRDQVRNPLLRALLDFLDRFANLFAQILGAVSLIVVKVLPLVPNLLAQFNAFSDLASELLETLGEAVSGIGNALMAPFQRGGGIGNILNRVFDVLMEIPSRLIEHLGNYLSDAGSDLGHLFDGITAQIGTYLGDVKDRIAELFWQTSLGQTIELIRGLLRIVPGIAVAIAQAWNTPGPPEPEEESGGNTAEELREGTASYFSDTPEAIADVLDRIGDLSLPALPDFSIPPLPEVPGLPNVPALQAEIGRAGPVDYAQEAERLFKEARLSSGIVVTPGELLARPASVFGAERRALRRLGRPTITADDIRLRDILFNVVGRVLPGDLRLLAPVLQSYFDTLDETIYGQNPPENRPHPQLELEDSGRLQPRIATLRIRATGAQAPDLRAFRDRLVDRIQVQDYRVPSGAGG